MLRMNAFSIEKFAKKLSDSNVIISRFVYVLPIIFTLFSIFVEEQQNS